MVSDKNTFSSLSGVSKPLIILRAYLLIIINIDYKTDDVTPIKDNRR